MKDRRRLARLTRAMLRVRQLALDALGADLAHSQLVCALADVRDAARRAAAA